MLLPLGREPIQLSIDCMEIAYESVELFAGLCEQELQILGRSGTLNRGGVLIQHRILSRHGVPIRYGILSCFGVL
jgi:hypothetical protein